MRFIGNGHTTAESIFEEGRYKVSQLGSGGDARITDINGVTLDVLKESHIEAKGNNKTVAGVSTYYMREIGLPKDQSHIEWVFTAISSER